MSVVNLADKLRRVTEYWSPKIVEVQWSSSSRSELTVRAPETI